MTDENIIEPETKTSPQPKTVFVISAEVGKVDFTVETENVLPTQFWAAGHMLLLLGDEAFANEQMKQMQAMAARNKLQVPNGRKFRH